METRPSASEVLTTYEELAPSDAVRPYVRAFFSYRPGPPRPTDRPVIARTTIAAGESFSGPMIAAAGASVVLALGEICDGGQWIPSDNNATEALVVGPTTRSHAHQASAMPSMVGMYLRPARFSAFTRSSAHELTDRIAELRGVVPMASVAIATGLERFAEQGTLEEIEGALLRHVRETRATFDADAIVGAIGQARGATSVSALAAAAGVSRQYLTRRLREHTGLGPKTLARLVRFHTLLRDGARELSTWSTTAANAGFADQSHLIAEFRRMTGLTPRQLFGDSIFHPFLRRTPTRA